MYQVVVVDDERNIRNGIVELIDWQDIGCEVVESFSNGRDVLQYLQRENAEVAIVVTDIQMPIMDGITLLKKLQEQYPDVVTIVLTAYSDFKYAQQAVKYDAVDFVVKNDFLLELPAAIEKAKSVLAYRQRGRGHQNSQLGKPDELEQIKLLTRIARWPEEVSAQEAQLVDFQQFQYCICACELKYYDKERQKENSIKILENFLAISIKNYQHLVVTLEETYFLIVIRIPREDLCAYQVIIQQFHEILFLVEEFMRLDMKLGISNVMESVSGAATAYQQAIEALACHCDTGNELKLYCNVLAQHVGEKTELDMEQFIGKLGDLALSGKKEQALEQLPVLKNWLDLSQKSFEQCKMEVLIICAALLRKMMKQDFAGDYHQEEQTLYQKIDSVKTLFSLLEICRKTVETVADACSEKLVSKSTLIGNVNQYILQNYASGITLQDISAKLFVNSSYLSRVYKKQTGNTITDTINLYRVKVAKQLLREHDCKIYEVCSLVGIDNPAYFTRVFIKYAGCTPTEYKDGCH